jgi:hypothetical protein
MHKRFLVIGGVIVLLGVVVTLVFLGYRTATDDESENIPVVALDPLDVVIDFYNDWLLLAQSTTTSPYDSDLINSPLLSEAVRTKVAVRPTVGESNSLDLVLCQAVPPNKIGAKVLYQLDTEAEFIILARGDAEKSPNQAVVKVVRTENTWQIINITCTTGDIPPVREFAFEQEGYLLKNLPPPLNPDVWHLVFEQDGVMGHTVPLFFTTESVCITTGGTESVCDTATFTDAKKVFIQADMSESGAVIKRLHFEN